MLPEEEIEARRKKAHYDRPTYHTPWQQVHGETVGQLQFGACADFMLEFHDVGDIIPRHNH